MYYTLNTSSDRRTSRWYSIVKLIENEAVFVNYKYPIILVAGIILVVVIIQISISKILINGIQKDSLINRINNVGD